MGYTSRFFVGMNVVPTSGGQCLADGFTLLGSTLLHCGAVLRGTLSGLFVSPAALQFLLSHRFVSRRHCPFAN